MDFLFSADALVALITLTFLEIVLGIDNVIFISIVTGKLPQNQRKKATRVGLFAYSPAIGYFSVDKA